MRLIIVLFFSTVILHAVSLKEEIANMLIVGFSGTQFSKQSPLAQTIHTYSLGGVILFSPNLQKRKEVISLTHTLQKLHEKKLFIALDQEGGYVDRLGKIEGSFKTPSAEKIAAMKHTEAKKYYLHMAKEMKQLGFNLNFAPVVDLCVNPANKVIVGFKRSYGKDPKKVTAYAQVFIEAMHQYGIITTLKHFPGHGSSNKDSHEGFTDVTQSWLQRELLPYIALISEDKADMIMSAHIYNKKLDNIYPATLSFKTITSLLRKQLHYNGVVISDDLQMGAIRNNYSLRESIALAINAGVDMLLFGNQIGKPYAVGMIIEIIEGLVEEGVVARERIHNANMRINALKAKY